MTIGIRRLGHVALTVSDVDAAVAFYGDVLGLTVSDRETIQLPDERLVEGAWMRCGTDHHCIALFSPAAGPASPNGADPRDRPGLNHLAFELATFAELQAAHAALKARGVEIVAQRQYGPGSQVRFYCLDPDGNRVEIYWDLDQVGWDGVTREPRTIEDIDLEAYDLDAFLAYKRSASAEPRPR
jgi:catechol 2,3-dioxygenase-like lactoylglutathione lyase family enzyme